MDLYEAERVPGQRQTCFVENFPHEPTSEALEDFPVYPEAPHPALSSFGEEREQAVATFRFMVGVQFKKELATTKQGKQRCPMKHHCSFLSAVFGMLLMLAVLPAIAATTDDENGEYQLNINPHAKITDEFSTFGNFGYYYDPHDYSKYRFGWPGIIYRPYSWLQFPGGLDAYYEDNFGSANTLELRPFAGVKFFVPNKAKLTLYNYTRYEYHAIETLDTGQWSGYSRIRSRFGAVFPLIARACAWKPKTFYGLVDVEPFYRFDKDAFEPLRVRGGVGYVMSDRVRAELIYTAEWDDSSSGNSLTYNHSSLRLNISVALDKGLLGRLLNPD